MPQFIVGIDLGTTNTALAFLDLRSTTETAEVQLFSIPQLVNAGEVAAQELLPSSLYIPGPSEFVEGALALPWKAQPEYITGSLAKSRGVENANRLVASAKSWLSNQSADPQQALLPLNAPEGVPKISPVEASRQYLLHLREAWNAAHPDAPVEQQTVLITVPASFDPAARDLTLKAAQAAGYGEVTLLEEPQAAFYSWLGRNPKWRERVRPGDLILVVDIGGGTTDFTLIAITEAEGELQLERVAVGDHLLLGGDNMDLAITRAAEAQFSGRGVKLDAVQFQALWQQSRAAKEVLLSGSETEEAPITILGRGTGLIGGTLRGKINAEEVQRLLLDGFFPPVERDAAPARARRTALLEVGLTYAADPAVTKHLAQFLRLRSGEFARPTHVLLNGGVLRARAIEQRLMQVLNSWLEKPVEELGSEEQGYDLMFSVAKGAAYYGLARTGRGVRIRGGVPRTYYVGIESSLPAVPGMPAPLKALVVVPFGLEEGSKVELPQKRFALVVGEPAEFRFFSSATRKDDAPGTLLEEVPSELEELPPIQVMLEDQQSNSSGAAIPVTLESSVTETGLLELWCVAADGRRWKLEFNVRDRSDHQAN